MADQISSLHSACKEGKLDVVKERLKYCQERDVDPFLSNADGDSVFHVASLSPTCGLHVLEELITTFRFMRKRKKKKGSGINSYLSASVNSKGYTPLHCACESNKLDYVYVYVKELRFFGNNPKCPCTPFEIACCYNNSEIASFLLTKCPSLYEDFSKGLILAYNKKFIDLMKSVCTEHKATVKVLNSLCRQQEFNIVKFCVDKKLCKQEGRQLALTAASQGEVELFEYLLSSKMFDVSAVNKNGDNILHSASTAGQLAIVCSVLKAGHSSLLVNENKEGKKSPLDILFQKINSEEMTRFCEEHLKMNLVHMFCLKHKHTKPSKDDINYIERVITDSPSFVIDTDIFDKTPLDYAYEHKQIEVIEIIMRKVLAHVIVQNGADHSIIFKYQSEHLKATTSKQTGFDLIIDCVQKVVEHQSFNPCFRNKENKSLLFFIMTDLPCSSEILDSLLDIILQHPLYSSKALNDDAMFIMQHYCQSCYHKRKKVQNEKFFSLFSKITQHHHFDPANVSVEGGNTFLHLATACNWLELIQHFLHQFPKIPVNAKNKEEKTPLEMVQIGIENSCTIFELLIGSGAQVSSSPIDDRRNTLLHFACSKNSPTLLRKLLQTTVITEMLNAFNDEAKTPLHLLCSHPKRQINVECFEILLSHPDVKVDCTDTFDKRPLQILTSGIKFAAQDQIKRSAKLITQHPSFKPNNAYIKENLLCLWCSIGLVEFVEEIIFTNKTLLKGRYSLNAQNKLEETLLHVACRNCNPEIVEYLLSVDEPSITSLNKHSQTPFHSLCWEVGRFNTQNCESVLSTFTLLSMHPSFESVVNCTVNNETALHLLCRPKQDGDHKASLALLQAILQIPNVDPNIRDRNNTTPLMLACRQLLPDHVKSLLASPAIIVNSSHLSSLANIAHSQKNDKLSQICSMIINHYNFKPTGNESEKFLFQVFCKSDSTVFPKRIDLLKSLLSYVDGSGNTALHIACKKLAKEAVSYFLRSGSAYVSPNKQSQTPFHVIATCKGSEKVLHEIFTLLVSHSSHDENLLSIQDSDGNTCLHLACKTSNVALVTDIAKANSAVLSIQNNEGNTPLHIACMNGLERKAIISALLAVENIDLHIKNDLFQTPLHVFLACLKLEVDIDELESYIEFSKDNVQCECLSLNEPTFSSANEVCRLLMGHSSYTDDLLTFQDHRGNTCLHLACLSANVYLVTSIIERVSIEVNIQNNNRRTAMHIACEMKAVEIINVFLQCEEIDLTVQDKNQNNPIHCLLLSIRECPKSCPCRSIDNSQLWDAIATKVTCLRQKNVETKRTRFVDEKTYTPLHLLASKYPSEFDRLCVADSSRFDLNIQDNHGNTPLHLACLKSSSEFTSALSSIDDKKYANADVSIKNSDGNTALHLACKNNCGYFIKILAELMEDINLRNNAGATPLHCLCAHFHNDRFAKSWELLLSRSSFDPNVQDKSNSTILHFLCKQCQSDSPNLEAVKLLVDHPDTDLALRDSDNNTCYHHAYFSKNNNLIKLLLQKNKGDISPVTMFLKLQHSDTDSANSWTAIQQAMSIKSDQVFDEDGNTALHLACQTISLPVVKKMLRSFRRKIENIPTNKSQQTPLHLLLLNVLYGPNPKQELKTLLRYDWALLFKCGINKQDNKGNTLLHYICEEQNVPLLQMVASKMICDFDIRNNDDFLPLTIAEKTGNKSFFLRVLIKYLEKQGNQQHLVSYYKTVLKVGVIPIKIVKCILTGPPEAGKSTLKQRLLGEMSILDMFNYYYTGSVSTGVSDSPLIVAVRNVSRDNAIVSDTKWTTLGFRDQAIAILETLTSTIHDAIQDFPSNIGQATSAESVVSNIQASTLEQAGKNTESLSSKCFKSNFQESRTKDKKNKCQDLEWPVRELRKMVNSIPAEKSKSNSQKLDAIEDLNKNPMLHIIDTGGQPELHELLPVFVTGPAINLVVFRLDKPFQKQYEIQYRKEGSTSEPYQSSLTHEEMVFRSLASIASLGYGHQLPTDSDSDQSPAAFIIATHKDLVTPEVVRETNRYLESVIKDGHFYKKDIVRYCNEDQAIFALNCIGPKGEEIDDLRKRVFKVVEQDFDPLDVPVPWLILSIKLQMAFDKKQLDPVISYDKCREVAETCGVQSDDLKNVLWFFHNAMGVVMYFPTVPDLESIVILDLQVIFDCITELISSCFLFKNTGSKVGSEDFSKYGRFSMKNLKRVLSEKNISNFFTAKQMVALLLHLHVIARQDEDKVRPDEDKYFMPCALKPKYEFTFNADSSPACLLVGFECGYCPVGLFTSLVVYLLSNKKDEWKLTNKTQYRNEICFRVSCLNEVTFIARPTYLEIQVSRKSLEVPGSQADVCQNIRSVVNEGINVVLKPLHYVDTKHYFGFLCPIQDCKPSHPAKVCEVRSCLPQAYICERKDKIIRLEDKHLIWYGKESAIEKLDKILEIPDLNDVFDKLANFNDWMRLGLALGLYMPTLDKIEQKRGSDVDRCKMDMLDSWLKKADNVERKGGPTWRQLISALEKINKALADEISKSL